MHVYHTIYKLGKVFGVATPGMKGSTFLAVIVEHLCSTTDEWASDLAMVRVVPLVEVVAVLNNGNDPMRPLLKWQWGMGQDMGKFETGMAEVWLEGPVLLGQLQRQYSTANLTDESLRALNDARKLSQAPLLSADQRAVLERVYAKVIEPSYDHAIRAGIEGLPEHD